jgi:hypothetical protein
MFTFLYNLVWNNKIKELDNLEEGKAENNDKKEDNVIVESNVPAFSIADNREEIYKIVKRELDYPRDKLSYELRRELLEKVFCDIEDNNLQKNLVNICSLISNDYLCEKLLMELLWQSWFIMNRHTDEIFCISDTLSLCRKIIDLWDRYLTVDSVEELHLKFTESDQDLLMESVTRRNSSLSSDEIVNIKEELMALIGNFRNES